MSTRTSKQLHWQAADVWNETTRAYVVGNTPAWRNLATLASMAPLWLSKGIPDEMLHSMTRQSDEAGLAALNTLLSQHLVADEHVLWARRLMPSGSWAAGAELVTSRQVLRLLGQHVTVIPWTGAARVTLTVGWNGYGRLEVVGRPEGYSASWPPRILLTGCRDLAGLHEALRHVSSGVVSRYPQATSLSSADVSNALSAAWHERLSGLLAPNERLLEVGNTLPEPLVRRLGRRITRLWTNHELFTGSIFLLMLTFIASLILLLVGQVAVLLGALPFATALGVLAFGLLWPGWSPAVYALSDRRLLLIQGLRPYALGAGYETFFALDPELLMLRGATAEQGSAEVLLNVEFDQFEPCSVTLHLPAQAATTLLPLLRTVYGAVARPATHHPQPTVSATLAALSPVMQVRLKQKLWEKEQVLWLAQVRLTTQDAPLARRVYVLTNQRALLLDEREAGTGNRTLPWNKVRRVRILRHANGTGILTLTLPSTSRRNTYHVCDFRNCPAIATVQRLVERQLFGNDSEPRGAAASVDALAHASDGTGVPETWWQPIADELLPGEQVRWTGRAAPAGIPKFVYGTALWLLIPLALVAAVALYYSAWPIGIGALLAAALTAVAAKVVVERMRDTAYVVTDRRALLVRGMHPGTRSRMVEFYPQIEPEQIRIPSGTTGGYTHRMGSGLADVVVDQEIPGSEVRWTMVQFIGIPADEVALVRDLLVQAYSQQKSVRHPERQSRKRRAHDL